MEFLITKKVNLKFYFNNTSERIKIYSHFLKCKVKGVIENEE